MGIREAAECRSWPLDDHSGIIVTLVGTGQTSTTDINGLWRLEDVPTGVYVIRCEKPGVTSFEFSNIQFVGTGSYNVAQVELHVAPNFTVESVSFTPNASRQQFDIVGEISESVPVGKMRHTRIAFSTDSGSDFKPLLSAMVGAASTSRETGGSQIAGVVPYYSLAAHGITSGTTVYFKVYPSSLVDFGYDDLVTREMLLTSCVEEGALVVSAVMP